MLMSIVVQALRARWSPRIQGVFGEIVFSAHMQVPKEVTCLHVAWHAVAAGFTVWPTCGGHDTREPGRLRINDRGLPSGTDPSNLKLEAQARLRALVLRLDRPPGAAGSQV